jgi:hypothetical protein
MSDENKLYFIAPFPRNFPQNFAPARTLQEYCKQLNGSPCREKQIVLGMCVNIG